MGTTLVHEGAAFVNFRDHAFARPHAHAYRWVDVKRFRIPSEGVSDRDLLAALIAHEHTLGRPGRATAPPGCPGGAARWVSGRRTRG